MDIGEVKRKYGDRVRLIGNIDCGELLSHGSPESVEDAVAKCVADAGMGGGFMLSSSNSIHSSVDPENYLAMVRAGKSTGNTLWRLKPSADREHFVPKTQGFDLSVKNNNVLHHPFRAGLFSNLPGRIRFRGPAGGDEVESFLLGASKNDLY